MLQTEIKDSRRVAPEEDDANVKRCLGRGRERNSSSTKEATAQRAEATVCHGLHGVLGRRWGFTPPRGFAWSTSGKRCLEKKEYNWSESHPRDGNSGADPQRGVHSWSSGEFE